eukprot:gene8851-6231_t
MAGNEHDQSTDIFSSEGRVFQVEYACKGVENSSSAIAACCVDGVVVAVEKLLTSRMQEPGSNNRIFPVDRQAGICICGMLPDGKAIVSRAREEAEQSREVYSTPILGSVLANRIASYMHVFTTYFSYRPFGCSVILGSYADDGPQLFVSDPSGTVAGYYGIALGKGKIVAKSELEKLDYSKLTCEEAVKKLVNILHDVHDKQKDKLYEIEVAWVCDKSQRRWERVPADLIPPMPEEA